MSDESVSRREFGLSLAALPAIAAAVSAAETTPLAAPDTQKPEPPSDKTADNAAKPAAEKGSPAEAATEPDEVPEAAWLLGLILKRYPDERLDEPAMRGILGDIQSDLRRSKTLADFPLENSDEPGLVFRPFVGE